MTFFVYRNYKCFFLKTEMEKNTINSIKPYFNIVENFKIFKFII